MQQEIHPSYGTVKATCSCGNEISVGSTLGRDIHLDICNRCHPFYTGQKREAVSGQIEKFRNRFKTLKSDDKSA
jgi:large subunit ribosomal protein L31